MLDFCRTLLTQMLEFAARSPRLTQPASSFGELAVLEGWLLTAALLIATNTSLKGWELGEPAPV